MDNQRDRDVILRSIFFIIILGLVIYSNSLNSSFIWDDDHLIRENAYIRSWSNITSILTRDIGAGSGREYNFYRPLQLLSYRVDYSLWRLEAGGYHLTNVLLHILAVLSIYWFVNLLFNNNFISILSSALFIAHPIHTEAVSYISGRSDPLSLIFIMIFFIFYIKHLSSMTPHLYIFALLSYILALLSRESSLILPLLVLLYHYAFDKKLSSRLFMPVLIVALVYILIRVTILGQHLVDLSRQPPLLQRLPGFFVAISDYMRLLLLPLNLHMEYGNRLFNFGDPKAIIGILITSFFLIYVFKKRRTRGLIFFAISWFFISLLPVSHIYPLNAYMAEHWLYLASVGFCLILANGLYRIGRSGGINKVFAIALAAILLSFYSYLTFRQNEYWREPITFYLRTLKYAPGSPKIYYNLGTAYNAIGRYKEAIRSYKEALEAKEDYADAYFNLGNSYLALREYEEAIAAYNKALEISPAYSKAYNNLGNIYSDMGDNEKAIFLYTKAIEADQNNAFAHYNLGDEYRKMDGYKEAIKSYKKALNINPHDAATHNNLAVAYYNDKQFDLSIKHCDKAIELGLQVHPEFLKALEPHR